MYFFIEHKVKGTVQAAKENSKKQRRVLRFRVLIICVCRRKAEGGLEQIRRDGNIK